MKGRVQIEAVSPSVECGRYAAKAVIGDDVIVGADIFREGHEILAAAVRYKGPDGTKWLEQPLRKEQNDRWYGAFPVDVIGPWRFSILAWTDYYATWLDGLRKNHAAGKDVGIDLADGAALLDRRRKKTAAKDRGFVDAAIEALTGDASVELKVAAAGDPDLLAALSRNPERLDLTVSKPDLPLWVDRERALFSSWYEMFPRSEGATESTSGTFSDAAKRLPAIADMGFDVLYLPPIHPIGRTNRKGTEGPHDLNPGPDAPGVPWAIGGEAGGHTAVHPDLGTIEDFDEFVAEAGRHGLEVALDFAIQCSPDHPWVTEHPEWFKHRSDGSIKYAENPPKQYQDIYPIDFDTADYTGLRDELKRVVDYWISHGIRIFRVDNPHTKALPFWEWLIDEVHAEHPDVLFLAEAFTRPKMMKALAKLGFSQSYTYFAWRNVKWELEQYLTELTQTEMANYYRPNFWPNTPDILTEYLQHGGPPAFKIRLVLAALTCPSYGIYSGYELFENEPLHAGSEEYARSEKYNYRPRNWDVEGSLAGYITKINEIRHDHRAFRGLRNLWLHPVSNDNLFAFSKVGEDRTDAVLTVVNLDPHNAQAGATWLDMWQLGLEHAGPFEAYDLITGTSYIWHGPENFVRLDPQWEPAHVLKLRAL
jgi:starch synthase (maltosyl-transferring)